jgi:rhodanese-related sulfurtransferase
MPHLTPRWILQYFGTDVCRMAFHDDIWIASLEKKLLTSEDNIVISDCRFPNEFKAIQNTGGKIIRVKRGDDPEWFKIAEIVNRGPEYDFRWDNYKTIMDSYNIHHSEWAWAGLDYAATLENNGTVDELYNQINSLII